MTQPNIYILSILNLLKTGLIILVIGGVYVWVEEYIPTKIRPLVSALLSTTLICMSCMALLFWTKLKVFKYMLPLAISPLIWLLIGRQTKQYFNRNYRKPSGSNEWICRKCGEENFKIRKDCYSCGALCQE